MSVTIRIPSNPMTNGITPLQATVFNPVAAHYSIVSYVTAAYMIRNSGVAKKPLYFPKNEDGSFVAWMARNYLATESMKYADILAWKAFIDTGEGKIYVSDLSRFTAVQLQDVYLQSYAFYLDVQTDSITGQATEKWKTVEMTHPMPKNFQTGDQFAYPDVYHVCMTVLGLSFNQIAGNVPGTVPAQRRAAGQMPW